VAAHAHLLEAGLAGGAVALAVPGAGELLGGERHEVRHRERPRHQPREVAPGGHGARGRGGGGRSDPRGIRTPIPWGPPGSWVRRAMRVRLRVLWVLSQES